jgi:hypothetical protein
MKFYNPFKPHIVEINKLYYIKIQQTTRPWFKDALYLNCYFVWHYFGTNTQYFSTQEAAENFWLEYSARTKKEKEACTECALVGCNGECSGNGAMGD